MNRELQQVRRYWPRAKRNPLGGETFCSADMRFWCGKREGGWGISAGVDCVGLGATIADAMRAAGFGARPLGKHARDRVKRAEYRKQLIGYAALGPSWAAGAARLLAYYQPRLADRQRPRKGARLGRRKREVQP